MELKYFYENTDMCTIRMSYIKVYSIREWGIRPVWQKFLNTQTNQLIDSLAHTSVNQWTKCTL